MNFLTVSIWYGLLPGLIGSLIGYSTKQVTSPILFFSIFGVFVLGAYIYYQEGKKEAVERELYMQLMAHFGRVVVHQSEVVMLEGEKRATAFLVMALTSAISFFS